jgi:hypothetical protein
LLLVSACPQRCWQERSAARIRSLYRPLLAWSSYWCIEANDQRQKERQQSAKIWGLFCRRSLSLHRSCSAWCTIRGCQGRSRIHGEHALRRRLDTPRSVRCESAKRRRCHLPVTVGSQHSICQTSYSGRRRYRSHLRWQTLSEWNAVRRTICTSRAEVHLKGRVVAYQPKRGSGRLPLGWNSCSSRVHLCDGGQPGCLDRLPHLWQCVSEPCRRAGCAGRQFRTCRRCSLVNPIFRRAGAQNPANDAIPETTNASR